MDIRAEQRLGEPCLHRSAAPFIKAFSLDSDLAARQINLERDLHPVISENCRWLRERDATIFSACAYNCKNYHRLRKFFWLFSTGKGWDVRKTSILRVPTYYEGLAKIPDTLDLADDHVQFKHTKIAKLKRKAKAKMEAMHSLNLSEAATAGSL